MIATAPVQPDEPRTGIRGDMLSCFTASIGQYMSTRGVDYETAIGTQLFLASCDKLDGLPIGFAHYHTPVLAKAFTPVRRRAMDVETAIGAIIIECRRHGAVIVVGDAGRLPWLVGFGTKHVPHWFVVDDVSPDGGSLHVTDRFEFIDEEGTQPPFSGSFGRSAFMEIIGAMRDWGATYHHRERWAFGTAESGLDATGSADPVYDWFEATGPDLSASRISAVELLRTSVACHSGAQRPASFSSEWYCGLDAVRMLPGFFESHLADPDLYAVNDDIWVIARTRQFLAHTLCRIADDIGCVALRELSESTGEELVAQWLALPRVMRYNAMSLQRGRPPRGLLVDVMRQVVTLEEQFVERLDGIVRSL